MSNGDTPRLSEWGGGPERRGFTLDYDLTATEIITPVGVSEPYGTGLDDSSPVLARAGFDGVWDTGATCSVVSLRIAVPAVRVIDSPSIGGADVLIGMDIIGRGDFAVTNLAGRTRVSFEAPSTRRIDFAEDRSDPAP